MYTSTRASAFAGTLLPLLAGCAGTGGLASPSAPGPDDPAATPAGPAADTYSSPMAGHAPTDRDSLRELATEAIASAAASLGMAAPARDARLDRAADDIARGVRGAALPSFEAVGFLTAHYGLVEPEPNLVLARGTPGAERAIVDHVRPQLPQVLRQGRWRRLGVGLERGTDALVLVLALQEQHLELAPLPRELPRGGYVKLAGRLLDGFRRPHVVVTVPRGGVRHLTARETRGRFEANLACGEGDGVYQVEIGAEDARGPAVMANFPLFCGVAAPRRAPVALADETAPGRLDPAAIEREVLTLVNRDRASAGLPPVRWDDRLTVIARAHSREMAETGAVAHVSPRTGSAADRVLGTGLRPLLVTENVGRAYSAGQAQRGFMSSPGHRANVIDPRVTHLGVGVALGAPEAGSVPVFVTQLFAAGL